MKEELDILLSDLLKAGEESLGNAYAVGKSYAGVKSGVEVAASEIDYGMAAKSIDINAVRIAKMISEMEAAVMALDPGSYATGAEYMAAIDLIIDKYANRVSAISHFAEEAFVDGFIQGGIEVSSQLATDMGIDSNELGFIWVTTGDERVCPVCMDLEGRWFPLEHGVGEWSAHPGCRCPEHFKFGVANENA